MDMSVKSPQAVYYPLLPRRNRIKQLKLSQHEGYRKGIGARCIEPKVPAGKPLCKKK
jgi:hypothetical protein